MYSAVVTSVFANDVITCYEKTKSEKYVKMLVNNSKLFKKEYLQYDAGEYKDMLNRYLEAVIAKGKYHKIGKNTITVNYQKVFDSAALYFQNELLDYIQFICLKHIKEQSSSDEFQKYFSKFHEHTNNVIYVRYFNENYLNEKYAGSNGDYVRAANTPDNKSFSSLLQAHKGKILYIDIWASWCAPCRAVMEDAKKLQSEFSADAVNYIYLSIDENLSAWRNAASNDISAGYPFSYLFINPKQSVFLKQIKLSSIPRYIIIDKEGKVVNYNAPGPDTKEIRVILKEMINNTK